ncbi:LLM class flavin-dependent oxidoreductase [Halalkalibacter sp. APA_J-10(15)]|uniref:LLM class flavin-dependent oxidoreductase n=1 Tax=Halalkalibacter sp. APA_J-10(15) TaxID=2933805 RepID=UPI001FF29837|nr:LLM class flavin-dependent oxidoreductase [Halalkalibacter sp. APA_J-10(15)]MCK0472206.1 LLM class flavin-dependent oxidoreductase [Halalkalibacter sp. APA_J-10(15)]
MRYSIRYSVLDLAPINEGQSASDSFKHSVDLAKHTEKWGYHRFWLAEHHNMPGIASAATSVLIGHIAQVTSSIRVGSGGIMLPNHSPLVIAEQFGTLESLFPGRIDLGLGRAPGTDQMTAQALRRGNRIGGQDFPELLTELRSYFNPSIEPEYRKVRAFPGEGLDIPIWLLGSSDFSARLSAELGLPFAFASHFSPENTVPALRLYKDHFTPSNKLDKPYAMVGVNIIVADTDKEADFLSSSLVRSFLNLIRNKPSKLQPPVEEIRESIQPHEETVLERQLGSSIIGSPETVKEKLLDFIKKTEADEIIVHTQIYDHAARLRSFELTADILNEINNIG